MAYYTLPVLLEGRIHDIVGQSMFGKDHHKSNKSFMNSQNFLVQNFNNSIVTQFR